MVTSKKYIAKIWDILFIAVYFYGNQLLLLQLFLRLGWHVLLPIYFTCQQILTSNKFSLSLSLSLSLVFPDNFDSRTITARKEYIEKYEMKFSPFRQNAYITLFQNAINETTGEVNSVTFWCYCEHYHYILYVLSQHVATFSLFQNVKNKITKELLNEKLMTRDDV